MKEWQAEITMKKSDAPFAAKSQDQVRKLIAGPNGAYICDECVDICAEIIEEEIWMRTMCRTGGQSAQSRSI